MELSRGRSHLAVAARRGTGRRRAATAMVVWAALLLLVLAAPSGAAAGSVFDPAAWLATASVGASASESGAPGVLAPLPDPLAVLAIQQAELTGNDGAADNSFGYSVAVSGDTAIVGAYYKTVGSNVGQGAAYVFTRSGTTWTQQQQLTAGDPAADDWFGSSVALSGDTALVGACSKAVGAADDQGAAYVFTRSGTTWTQQQKLTGSVAPANEKFGTSVALSGDTALVGASNASAGVISQVGGAYIFTRSGTTWTQQQRLTLTSGTTSDAFANFGSSVALSGDTALVGAEGKAVVGSDYFQGAAYVFTRSGTTWALQQMLTAIGGVANDWFGSSVALSGDTAIVGAYYKTVGSNVGQGAAYVFTRSGTTWTQQQQLTASDGAGIDYFGDSVALSGETALVGAYRKRGVDNKFNQGAAYVYTRSGTTWTQRRQLTASDGVANDWFGMSVALSGDTGLIGAPSHKVGSNAGQGAAYVFVNGAYTITPSVVGGASGHGTISPSSVQTTNFGATPTFTFAPDAGYKVKAVKVDGSAVTPTTATTYVFPAVSATHTISVEFAVDTYTITPSVVGGASGHGTISPDSAQPADYGATPTFTFAPDSGYHVEAVKVDGSAVTPTTATTYTFPAVTANHAISVEFAVDQFTITPSVAPGAFGRGTVTPVHGTITPDTPQTVDYGATPTFTFAPAPGYHVEEVKVDGSAVNPTTATTYTFPAVSANHTISVEFAVDTYTITPSVVGGASGHGTISPDAAQPADYGSTPKFTFKPEAGYHVKEVKVDDLAVSPTPAASYTFAAVAANHAIAVAYEADPRLTVGAPAAGSYSVGTTATVEWSVSSAVAAGSFRVWLKDTTSGAWVRVTPAASPVAAEAGRLDYSATWNVSKPLSSYRLWVYYYGPDGSSVLGSDAASGTVTVTPKPAPTVVSPNSDSFALGSTTTVDWSMSRAVSTGSFRVWLKDTTSGAWVRVTPGASPVPAEAGKLDYSVPWKVTKPLGTYRLWVYYYAEDGTTVVSSAASSGTISVIAKPAPTVVSPNSGELKQGAATNVEWSMSAAVSTGSFRVWLKNTVTNAWVRVTPAAAPVLTETGKTAYSVPWFVTQALGTYKLWVYYYGEDGSAVLATASSSGTVTIAAP